MLILFTAAIILCGIKTAPRKCFFENSFSVEQTRALKGLFAILVMFHHLYPYLASESASLILFKNIGYLMVGGFFLISGYGPMWGVMHKEHYLKGFFRKRVIPLLLTYYMIDLVYVAVNYVSMTSEDQFKAYVIESIFGLQLWFVPVMVMLYVLFRISFSVGRGRYPLVSPLILSFTVLLYVIAFFATQKLGVNVLYGRFWNNTVLCFVLGMWYCILKDRLKHFSRKYFVILTCSASLIFAALFYLVCERANISSWSTLFLEVISALVFCCVVLLVSMKVKLGNGILNIAGDLSFELYLSHAIFIRLFRWERSFTIPLGSRSVDFSFYISNSFLYIGAILVCSLLFSFAVHKICKLILAPKLKSVCKN